MAAYDLVLRGGTVVGTGALGSPAPADVAVSDGRIAAASPDLAEAGGEEVDARGLHVFSGAIDAHGHFNEPGRTHREGFASGTRALAACGATAFVEMPLNAHLALVDLDAAFVLGEGDLFYRHKASPFVGLKLRGRVVRTVVRGEAVFRDGGIVSRPLGRLPGPRKPAGNDP